LSIHKYRITNIPGLSKLKLIATVKATGINGLKFALLTLYTYRLIEYPVNGISKIKYMGMNGLKFSFTLTFVCQQRL